ncbi:MAG: HAD-IB family phosphatase [Gemmatimonadaceae bacterium]
MKRYASVVLDADSTIAGIEGIDWLAARSGPAAQRAVEALTARAMNGQVKLEDVYALRLGIIRATPDDLHALSEAYRAALAPGAADALAALHAAGVVVHVVSGGLRPALLPLTRSLNIADTNVHAVEPMADADGLLTDARPSPLMTQTGKPLVVQSLHLPRPVLAVGDGSTDLAMRPAVQAFAAYIGFVRRDAVVARADFTFDSFAALVSHVLSA